MRWILDTVGACFELARLFLTTRGRLRGPYWTWRRVTAWGCGPRPGGLRAIRAVLEYGRWVARMRRLR